MSLFSPCDGGPSFAGAIGFLHGGEAAEGGLGDVDGVAGAEGFGEDVGDARGFHDGADGAAGDDAGAFWTQGGRISTPCNRDGRH